MRARGSRRNFGNLTVAEILENPRGRLDGIEMNRYTQCVWLDRAKTICHVVFALSSQPRVSSCPSTLHIALMSASRDLDLTAYSFPSAGLNSLTCITVMNSNSL